MSPLPVIITLIPSSTFIIDQNHFVNSFERNKFKRIQTEQKIYKSKIHLEVNHIHNKI